MHTEGGGVNVMVKKAYSDFDLILTDDIACPAEWHWESGNNGWTGFHIWYVLEGGAEIRIAKGSHTGKTGLMEDSRFSLRVGDCFLFDLGNNYICSHNPNDPLRVLTAYFHADGVEAPDVRRWLIHDAALQGDALERAVKLRNESKQGEAEDAVSGTMDSAASRWVEAVFSEFLTETRPSVQLPRAVLMIVEAMENDTGNTMSLADMSAMTGYSDNQIIRLFKQNTGMTPVQYQNRCKIRHAKRLLLYSDNSIVSIGEEVGIPDPNYFSKVFRKYTGMSPKEYRGKIE